MVHKDALRAWRQKQSRDCATHGTNDSEEFLTGPAASSSQVFTDARYYEPTDDATAPSRPDPLSSASVPPILPKTAFTFPPPLNGLAEDLITKSGKSASSLLAEAALELGLDSDWQMGDEAPLLDEDEDPLDPNDPLLMDGRITLLFSVTLLTQRHSTASDDEIDDVGYVGHAEDAKKWFPWSDKAVCPKTFLLAVFFINILRM